MLRTTAAQKAERPEEITCFFCALPDSVFEDKQEKGKWDCVNCFARFYKTHKPGVTQRRPVMLQNFATMYDDSWMGFIKVHPVEGDIPRQTALSMRAARKIVPMKGFNALSEDFTQRLWSNSDGKPVLEFEAIEEVCGKFAYNFTPESERDRTTQLVFRHDIAGKINKSAMDQIHKLVRSIPRSNGNLIRYYVAEGQEDLILLAIRRAYVKYMTSGNLFGLRIVKSMCV